MQSAEVLRDLLSIDHDRASRYRMDIVVRSVQKAKSLCRPPGPVSSQLQEKSYGISRRHLSSVHQPPHLSSVLSASADLHDSLMCPFVDKGKSVCVVFAVFDAGRRMILLHCWL